MTLRDFQALKVWHAYHGGRPLEKSIWDMVLTLWLMGWVGGPASLLLHIGWAQAGCLAALFLPGMRDIERRGWLRRSRKETVPPPASVSAAAPV